MLFGNLVRAKPVSAVSEQLLEAVRAGGTLGEEQSAGMNIQVAVKVRTGCDAQMAVLFRPRFGNFVVLFVAGMGVIYLDSVEKLVVGDGHANS